MVETAGVKWAPETGLNVTITPTSAAAVTAVFANNAIATFPLDNRSAMMPDPTTAASSIAEPIDSAVSRLGTFGRFRPPVQDTQHNARLSTACRNLHVERCCLFHLT